MSKSEKNFAKEHALLFTILFAIVAILASFVHLSKLWGAEGQTFTLFEFIGPLPAAIFGPFLGILAILVAKIATTIYSGAPLDYVTFLRFLPVLFAAYFFAKYKDSSKYSNFLQASIPLLCILLFAIHPVGSQAWLFSLYWLIPPITILLLPRNLFFRSLSATFTQHAIGGVIWIYFVNPGTPESWLLLIPLVAIERLVFAVGIALSYMGSMKTLHLLKNSAIFRLRTDAPLPSHQPHPGKKEKH